MRGLPALVRAWLASSSTMLVADPVTAATFRPESSARLLSLGAPAFSSTLCETYIYGISLITLSRSAWMYSAETMASQWPETRSGMMLENATLSHFAVKPRCCASMLPKSTSTPAGFRLLLM